MKKRFCNELKEFANTEYRQRRLREALRPRGVHEGTGREDHPLDGRTGQHRRGSHEDSRQDWQQVREAVQGIQKGLHDRQ